LYGKERVGCEIPIHAELGNGPLEIGECAEQNGIFIRDCGFDAECAVEHAAIPRISSSRALAMHSAPPIEKMVPGRRRDIEQLRHGRVATMHSVRFQLEVR
jgi:hypothetical protein